MRVLLVDDETVFTTWAESVLSKAGLDVTSVGSGPAALELLASDEDVRFDLILLDLRLGGESGMDLLHELRLAGNETPVIILSGEESTQEKVRGLSMGADDYVVKKQLDVDELVARIEAVRRRRATLEPIEYGEVRVDLGHRRVYRRGTKVELSPREYDLLLALVRAEGDVVSREKLLKEVWDMAFDPGTNVLDVHVGRLRRKLDTLGGPLIQNQRGLGYRILASAD